jgi:hypothetical protein
MGAASYQGVVHQRILVWEPEIKLSFRMEQTHLYFRQFVCEIVETFDLVPYSWRGADHPHNTSRGPGSFPVCEAVVSFTRSQAGALLRLSELARAGS